MILEPGTYRDLCLTVYEETFRVADELLQNVGEAEVVGMYSRNLVREFVNRAQDRWGVKILPGDIMTRHHIVYSPFDDSTNEKVIRVRGRWHPATSEVLFQTGPLDGKVYAIEPGRIGQQIVSLKAPVEPWFAMEASDRIEPIIPEKVYYNLHSWDDELNCWVYQPN